MKNLFLYITALLLSACSQVNGYNDGYITYHDIEISNSQKSIIEESIKGLDKSYDPEGKMIEVDINGWNYHTDTLSGKYHSIRASFSYAIALLDIGNRQRAFDILEKTMSLQVKDTTLAFYGVWPYYEEEPLQTKKSPTDYNWADFNIVSLLDIYLDHNSRLPAELKKHIEESLILGAKSIRKRNCSPEYTNIAIMGTYCTYVVSHLFDIADLKEYATMRLKKFYDYTKGKGGFTEYNSPAYTTTAIDELERMKRHIVEPEAVRMIDELYEMNWDVIARHYHKHSAQWTGPHSRTYSTDVKDSFYKLLQRASQGEIDMGVSNNTADVRSNHYIPQKLISYFNYPSYPRIEKDTFEMAEPQVIGVSYMTDKYAISTANRSSLWNQRRPLTAFWGEPKSGKYFQVRFLHDGYDFSAASLFTQQKENNVIAVLNLAKNGGDKHINIDVIKGGKFKASDLRLRFEFGNCSKADCVLPLKTDDQFTVVVDGMAFTLKLPTYSFNKMKGSWQVGTDDKKQWVDFVFYHGAEREFDMNKMGEATAALIISIDNPKVIYDEKCSIRNGIISVSYNNMTLSVPVAPQTINRQPANYPNNL